MKTRSVNARRGVLLGIIAAMISAMPAMGDWQKDSTTLAWKPDAKAESKPIWSFSFDPAKGKSFFDPVRVGDGPAFTNFKPTDHPWHYGLWFSWKYINHTNYWEEDRVSGKAAGKTAWSPPAIETKADGSATIKMDVTYTNADGKLDMSETRELVVSAPGSDGAYTVDWHMVFTAGKEGAILDRTAMMGEPNGAVNGGYAGLSIRMAGQPLLMKVVTPAGPVTKFADSRARPNSPSVGCNFVTKEGKDVGGVAIISAPTNVNGKDAPWYLINDDTTNNGEGFRFACAALLAPKILTLKADEKMELNYRVAISGKAWTEESLKTASEAWLKVAKLPAVAK